jgi:glycosyltransferase involved in cell wall biosynthesis
MKVLVDLKPALDGYAGIPQECRLLFKGLSQLPQFEVEGLIQHGGRRLRSALPVGVALPLDRSIDRQSKFVVSLFEKPVDSLWLAGMDQVQKHFARHLLRLRASLGLSLKLSRFEARLFEDFVWRTFFSKTLGAEHKPLLEGSRHRVLTVPRQMMNRAGLDGLRWSGRANYARVDTRGFDVFVTQNPFPGRVARGTQMVVRYHDAVPVLMPHVTRDKAFDQASHFQSLKSNLHSGAWFSCISHATRNDLLTIFPQAEGRSFVIPNIVSDAYFREATDPLLVQQIIRNRLSTDPAIKGAPSSAVGADAPAEPLQYLLMVSTIEPRKNHALLMQAWETLRYSTHPQLKLVVVGNAGWDHAPVLNSFRPWAERGELFWLNNVPSAELRTLYNHAALTVCPGLAEGFDYSGVEAMKCGSLVAASDIPVHREIYREAATYFSAYDATDAAQTIAQALDSLQSSARAGMQASGQAVGQRYTEAAVLLEWAAFFERLAFAGRSPIDPATGPLLSSR